MKAYLSLSLLSLALAACRSTAGPGAGLPDGYRLDQVDRVIQAAAEDMDSGANPGLAFARLQLALETSGAEGDARLALETARAEAGEAWLTELVQTEAGHKEFEPLMNAELPRSLAVRARVGQARALLIEGERVKAYRAIRKMDQEFPFHADRQAAGRVLFDAGMSLALDPRRYGLVFHYKTLAPEVLEYFTTSYFSGHWNLADGDPLIGPSRVLPDLQPSEFGPEAYRTLGALYWDDGDHELAVQRLQDLIIYYGDSPLVLEARARIPEIRLESVQAVDHDRAPLETALIELDQWLEDFPGRDVAMEERVQQNRLHALQQLADHDRNVARFYARVDNPEGAEYHGRLALDSARLGGSTEQIEELETWLAEYLAEHSTGPMPQ
ncbi:MAG: hypothetical protein R3F17_16680 [Planctomycetota bacterium]